MTNPLNIPPELAAVPNWVCWRAEPNKDPAKKPLKVPYSARAGYRASSVDRADWCTFGEAMAASGNYSGIGFVLDGSGLAGVDIDHCVTDGTPDPAALALLDKLGAAYVELSPSGTGLRAFGHAPNLPSGVAGKLHGMHVELYTSGRYLTVTGNTLRRGPLGPLVGFAELAQEVRGGLPTLPALPGPRPPVEVTTELLAELQSAIKVLDADERDQWVRAGMALKELGDAGRTLWLEWSQRSDKFDAEDADRVWASFEPDRTGHAAIFAAAQRAGWVNPKARGYEALFGAAAPVAVPDFRADRPDAPTDKPRHEVILVNGADLKPEPVRWLWPG